jgi:hypothetical protein
MTSIVSNNNINKKQSSPKSKKYVCAFCSNTFSQSSGLSHHKKVCKGIIDACLLKDQLEKEKQDHEKEKHEKLKFITENEQLKQKVIELTNKINNNPITTLQQPYNNLAENKKRFICTYCNSENFSYQQSLSKHMKICSKKLSLEKKIEELIKEKEFLLEDKKLLRTVNENLNEDKKLLHKDKDIFANLATINGDIANTSVSAMKYLMTYYKDTPALKSIDNFNSMTDKYEDDTKLVYALISEYRNETLAAKLSDHLVLEYKKEKSSEQSLWSCDVGRLTYVIRNAVTDGRIVWLTDKNGIQVTKIVIKPILNFIKPILKKFNLDCSNEIINNPKLSNNKMIEMSEYQKFSIQIVMLIENKTLERDIIKHMAPQFYWNKNLFTKQSVIEFIEDDVDKQIKKQKNINHVKVKTSKPLKKDKVF